MPRFRLASTLVLGLLASLLAFPAPAKPRTKAEAKPEEAAKPLVDPALYQGLAWRNIGPFRGGRVTAVAGIAAQPMTFYLGSTGGGVWKTEDGGTTWRNVSDGFMKTGSVGALAVAPSDPNVVYAGMGEAPVRGVASSHGDGVYRSTDAGKTWSHLGLANTRQISRIAVHPTDPDLVYVAAQGSPWAPTPDRGIYRSADGGQSWQQVHRVSDDAGAGDLSMDPSNPRILFAAYWHHRRTPWKIESGGEGSGLWRTADGGDTWQQVTEGLPKTMGKIGVAVSGADPDRVWAMIEAEEGGLHRSDDGGKTWQRVNQERVLRGRAWYYTHVIADPRDADTVYVLNAPMLKSIDGGKTFRPIRTPHGDNHALWINPENSAWMINGNDGGANVSYNGGETWSTQGNQPTAQLYRVATDDLDPYTVYGGQQDNTTVAIKSAGDDGTIGREDWRPVGGCESAYVAFDPKAPRLIYAGCYHGQITEHDAESGRERDVMAYPVIGLASTPAESKYRFNWNAPIVVSRHDPKVIYHAANVLLRSRDRGVTWEEISPDLTGNDKAKQAAGGGPITNEGAGGEVYQTIFYLAESPHEAGTLWAGTDDGHVHLTRDGGAHWSEVTPPGIGEAPNQGAQINSIEVSPHDPATAWLAVTRYKFDDLTPQVWRTTDYGKTWKRTVEGIGPEAWVRVVREDTVRKGLLFAGTETGLYLSVDSGEHWQPFELNFPVVPVTDLVVHGDDLVASTQGRSFWVLDDLSPLRQLDSKLAEAELHLFQPAPARHGGAGGFFFDGPPPGVGANPPAGAVIDYALGRELDPEKEELEIEILDAAGAVVRSASSKPKPEEGPPGGGGFGPPGPPPLPAKKGMNRWVWDLTTEPPARVPGLFTFVRGGRSAPAGAYQVRASLGETRLVRPLEVRADPRLGAIDPAVADEHRRLLSAAGAATDEIFRAVVRLREVRGQIEALLGRTKEREGGEEIHQAGEALTKDLTALEEALVQTKTQTFQDVINFPNRLDAELGALLESVESGPPLTSGQRQRWRDLEAQWREHQAKLEDLLGPRLDAFNALVAKHSVPAIVVPKEKT